MPQTVPTAAGFSPSFDYSSFQFDLSLLSDDYDITCTENVLKPPLIKEEACSPRACSPSTYSSPAYSGLGGELSPIYSRDYSPGYPTSPYYLPHSPQSAQFYPTSPEPVKQPVKREKSLELLTILQESRLLAESLGYKEDSTDCTVPCTPPRTEEDIYNSLDADFHPKKDSNHLLKEILFKDEYRSSSCSPSSCSTTSISSASSSSSASLALSNSPASLVPSNSPSSLTPSSSPSSLSSVATSPAPEVKKSPLRDLLFKNTQKGYMADVLTESITELLIADEDDIMVLNANSNDLQESTEIYKDDKGDHQLLREVLRDTSFQRKFNLKPIDLGSVGTGFVEDMEPGECVGELAREQIEPVLSLAIQQLQKDFDNTCVALGIHPEPRRWSAADVAAWVQWARRQLQLPSIPLENFNIDGSTLAAFTEEDFCQRAPECGSMLHAQFEIWKAAVEESPRNTLAASWSPTGVVQSPSDIGSESPSVASSASGSIKGSCTLDYSDDEDEETSSTSGSSGGKIRSSGSHIHLWQFLKELLQSPSIHGSCIRWLDRAKGVFKIEDSVRVARLWGKRKNRPAMNYDKLSRSIRQYYKKGIMKKTERSQRLVYQFCHPYNL